MLMPSSTVSAAPKASLPVVSIADVVQRQLCTGCGVCAAVEPGTFEMRDAVDWGKRPFRRPESVDETGAALAACPGAELDIRAACQSAGLESSLTAGWGPVREVWEGYASDDAIRHAGSSGGAATALALFGLEKAGIAGVLHTTCDAKQPLINRSVTSQNRAELLSRTGSRYAPASPCDALHEQLSNLTDGAIFIGKPCDVAAVAKACQQNAKWLNQIRLTIAFFCAGTPSTRGTLDLLAKLGLTDFSRLRSLRYRGRGWPGMFTAEWEDDNGTLVSKQLTYAESWEFLQKYRQWRCYICPDHTGEFADISVGDPWYREVQPGEPGSSLIVVRTERGREFLRAAAEAGYVTLTGNDANLLPRSQPNLLATRGGMWGRLLVLRWVGAAVPIFRGFELKRFWWRLSLKQKLQSFTGTWKRVSRKRLRECIPAHEFKTVEELHSDREEKV